jgi:hypothetical protein
MSEAYDPLRKIDGKEALGESLAYWESKASEFNLGDGFHAVQSDGGGLLIVHETELPDFPRDGCSFRKQT